MFTTNNHIMVKAAKKCYEEYPTIVNKLKESGITYQNTMKAYSEMDNKFAKSRMGIGESSNLAQLAMTYYWSEPTKDLYDNFVILSVLAQVIIDGCKREFEVDGIEEIKRIKKLPCMERYKQFVNDKGRKIKVKCDFPEFMKYTKEVSYTKNGVDIPYEDIKGAKDKIKNRIDKSLVCPMNYLQDSLDKIKRTPPTNTTPTKDFFINIKGVANNYKMNKMTALMDNFNIVTFNQEDSLKVIAEFNNLITSMTKLKIKDAKTINRLIEMSLNIENNIGRPSEANQELKSTRRMLNVLYRINKQKFLSNFIPGEIY